MMVFQALGKLSVRFLYWYSMTFWSFPPYGFCMGWDTVTTRHCQTQQISSSSKTHKNRQAAFHVPVQPDLFIPFTNNVARHSIFPRKKKNEFQENDYSTREAGGWAGRNAFCDSCLLFRYRVGHHLGPLVESGEQWFWVALFLENLGAVLGKAWGCRGKRKTMKRLSATGGEAKSEQTSSQHKPQSSPDSPTNINWGFPSFKRHQGNQSTGSTNQKGWRKRETVLFLKGS